MENKKCLKPPTSIAIYSPRDFPSGGIPIDKIKIISKSKDMMGIWYNQQYVVKNGICYDPNNLDNISIGGIHVGHNLTKKIGIEWDMNYLDAVPNKWDLWWIFTSNNGSTGMFYWGMTTLSHAPIGYKLNRSDEFRRGWFPQSHSVYPLVNIQKAIENGNL